MYNMEFDLEEGSIKSESMIDDEEDGSFIGHYHEMQRDRSEQVVTVDQAHNIGLLEQLKALQEQQRQQMLREQHDQMVRLHAEQRATEARLVAQRQSQWGTSKAGSSLLVPKPIKELSPQRGSSGLPQAIAASTLALARIRLQESLLADNEPPAINLQQTMKSKVTGVGSLDGGDGDNSTSSDFTTDDDANEHQASDSDEAYLHQNAASESNRAKADGVKIYSISNQQTQSLQERKQPVNGQHVNNERLSLTTNVSLSARKNMVATSQSTTVASEGPAVSNLNATAERSRTAVSSAHQTLSHDGLTRQSVPGVNIGKVLSALQSDSLQLSRAVTDNSGLGNRQNGTVQQLSSRPVSECGAAGLPNGKLCSAITDVEDDDDDDEDVCSYEDSQMDSLATVLPFDDRPVQGAVQCGKTFEQLIEEQLRQDQQKQSSQQQERTAGARTFLRRGEGVARFKKSGPKSVRRRGQLPVANKQSPAVVSTAKVPTKPQVTNDAAKKLVGPAVSQSKNVLPTAPSRAVVAGSRESFGETSYLARMQERSKHDEVEVEELQEFELLEQFVDDNASMISNMSVSKILPLARVGGKKRTEHQGRGTADKSSKQSNNKTRVLSSDNKLPPTNAKQVLVETAPAAAICEPVQPYGDNGGQNFPKPPLSTAAAAVAGDEPISLRSIYRKIHSGKITVPENSRPFATQKQSGFSVELSLSDSDESLLELSGGDEEDADDDASGTAVANLNVVDRVSEEFCGPTSEQWNKENEMNLVNNAETDVRFNDDSEWHDNSVVEVPMKRHLNSSDKTSNQSSDVSSPPTSKLASKLFPKLKPANDGKKTKLSEQTKPPAADGGKLNNAENSSQSVAVREKLAQLEAEIQKFRNENAALNRLRKEQEQVVERLRQEMAEFEKQKAEELKRLEQFKAEEMKKLRKQQKLFEQFQEAAKAGPNKKEREENEALKLQISKLTEEMQKREQRQAANTARLKDRVEQLERENSELRQENRLLEQYRLENWKPKKLEQQKIPSQGPMMGDIPSKDNEDSTTATVKKSATSSAKPKAREAGSMPAEVPQPTPFASAPRTSSPLALSSSLSDETVSHMSKVVASKTASLGQHTHVNVRLSDEMNSRNADEIKHLDGKVERILPDGSHEIMFANGTRKQISADGQTIIVSYFNGDIKQILADGRVVYYYADAKTTHTTYSDGLQIFQFANRQVEKHYVDGTKEIQFPDQTIKYLFPGGASETVFPDGTVVRVENGDNKIMTFPNGQKEIHTKEFKRREYPDGTTKTIYVDGRQETQYSNGRLRVKDADGRVLIDRIR